MPADSHAYHTDKMKRCLQHLEDQGWDPGKAHAICYSTLGSEANKVEKGKDPECTFCEEIAKRVVKRGEEWCVTTEDGSKTLGCHDTQAKAIQQLAAVEANKRGDRIVVKNAKQRYTLGIVYEPDTLDTDNEFTDAAELEKACWDFMRDLQGMAGTAKAALLFLTEIKKAVDEDADLEFDLLELDTITKYGVNAMHAEDLDDCEVVECYIAPVDMKIGEQTVKKGTWLAGIVWSEDVFKKIQDGEWTGYSMGGWARKVHHDA